MSSNHPLLAAIRLGGSHEAYAIRKIYEEYRDILQSVVTSSDELLRIVETFVLAVKDGIYSEDTVQDVPTVLADIAAAVHGSTTATEEATRAVENQLTWEYYSSLFRELPAFQQNLLLKTYIDKVPIEEIAKRQYMTGHSSDAAQVIAEQKRAIEAFHSLI